MTKEITNTDKIKIKSFKNARAATGRPNVPAFSDVPEDLREYFQAQYKLIVIAEAINEGWKPCWWNNEQEQWIPVHHYSPPLDKFPFAIEHSICSLAFAGTSSRLCFKSGELARYAGRQFRDLWNIVLMK